MNYTLVKKKKKLEWKPASVDGIRYELDMGKLQKKMILY